MTRHELASIISSLDTQGGFLNETIPALINSYKTAIDAGLVDSTISVRALELLGRIGMHMQSNADKLRQINNEIFFRANK